MTMATSYYLPNQDNYQIVQESYNIPEIPPTNNFLAPNQCLVYIENLRPFADVDGSTQIAKIIRSYIHDDRLWFDLMLETDSDGDKLISPSPVTVSGDKIVSDRDFHDIQPRQIYNFALLTFSDGIEYPIKAGSFVIKKNINKPLESTSRTALGSGIYGRYISDRNEIPTLLTESNQSVYLIDCPNAYIIQDKEHGESITIASLNTNRYLDRIIQSLREYTNPSLEIVQFTLHINESPILLTLWNIVLYRTQEMITQEWLENILLRYIIDYFGNNNLVDSINGDIINELPINYIMKGLGYDALIASDPYNNGWNRGCVSYNYSQAIIIQGETARY
jgi:hypothetical protein